MRRTINDETADSVDILAGSVPWTSPLPESWVEAWRQRLVRFVLVFSDVLLALLVEGASFVLQNVWGSGPLSAITIASVAPTVVVWVGLRVLLGLYPGYGLDQAEELRRQIHALLATLAITATFAVALQVTLRACASRGVAYVSTSD